ncbi:hypothetical protein T440DRAFT_216862 [Plenodomus tracheiphilus IPT5]|uniref:Uncharacterized protein n=1 Tax=Plenodomus tracheiphilus IPT5 TaxID=1408161 RepID=A0A6A7AVE5_9PLEO|nr:hypothetical protein T440DRAFT_216862 [Plenodomus tracheiphilus IPT5]
MSWWRRDPSLAPARQHAQRLLRPHEAALRTRCFSRTLPQHAQHEEDHGKRPSGMSNLEWMHLQHYKRWQKRFTEDPYNAIFGASNDMLAGKGLKDWEWVNKSFPKWMLREMESVKEYMKESISEHNKQGGSTGANPVRIDSTLSHFPRPPNKTTRFDRDDTTGIASPSDIRRPREQSHVEVSGNPSSVDSETLRRVQVTNTPSTHSSAQSVAKVTDVDAGQPYPTSAETQTSNKEASEREGSFIEQILVTETDHQAAPARAPFNDSTWRQTALQRRALQKLAPQPDTESSESAKSDEEVSNVATPGPNPSGAPATQITNEVSGCEQNSTEPSIETQSIMQETDSTARSTAQRLDQLPKDDLDFLSADEIRAAMRARKRKFMSHDERVAERKRLEHAFQVTGEPSNVDSMIEAKTVNDQMVRRLERELSQPDGQAAKLGEVTMDTTNTAKVPAESSIDRLKKWLEQGGAVFASHFWQDPTEEADAKKTRLFFDRVIARIRKGRVAMRQVIEDLEADIPASKPLLKRMKQDEDLLDSAIQALRVRSHEGKSQGLSPRKLRAIQTLRLKFQDTDRELDTAYVALQESATPDAVAAVSSAFKRRLAIASRITQKNANLSRYLIWSLQARLEDPEINKDVLANYKAVANSLLTLRDTQTALARLIDHAISTYGVEAPKALDDLDALVKDSVVTAHESLEASGSPPALTPGRVDKAQIRADVAAEERLASEVEAQKLAMRGLSDDGYAHRRKPTQRKPLEERSALAHSLFRPFGPVIESLTKDTSAQALKADEETRKALHDANLVAEVRAAYEETYGPITVGHKQLAQATEEVNNESEREVKQFNMLKDDPISTPAHTESLLMPGSPGGSSRPSASNESATGSATVNTEEIMQPASISSTEVSTAEVPVTAIETNTLPHHHSSENSNISADLLKLPTHYTILLYNAQTDNVTVSTSTSPPPRDVTPLISLPQALATLNSPSKFIPYIPEGLEIVSAKKDMLVLRNSLATSQALSTHPSRPPNITFFPPEEPTISRRDVNPIDGTTRLSPTGYVGPEESQEQLEKEFEERRQAAEKITSAESQSEANKHRLFNKQNEWEQLQEKRKGGAGSVVKTAIWAAATCYVFGVVGEIVSGA